MNEHELRAYDSYVAAAMTALIPGQRLEAVDDEHAQAAIEWVTETAVNIAANAMGKRAEAIEYFARSAN